VYRNWAPAQGSASLVNVILTHVLQTVDEVAKDFPEIQGSQVLAFFAQMMRKFSKVRLRPQY
jgi:hypothetical protein